jgi:hypothetical protein
MHRWVTWIPAVLLVLGCADGGSPPSGDGGDGDDQRSGGCTVPSGGQSVAACGIEIRHDGVLDLDIRTVEVSGRVTLRGGALPSGSAPTLRLVREGQEGGGIFLRLAAVRERGGSYQTRLLPGSYKIIYDQGSCGEAYPCQQGVVLTTVQLTQSGVLDIDIPAVRVDGRVTVDRAPPPGASLGAWPSLRIRGEQGSTGILVQSGEFETGSYHAWVIPGRYDALYDRSSASDCEVLPCQVGGVVATGLQITTDGVLDLDVPTARVAGMVTLDGTAVTSLEEPTVRVRGEDGSSGILARLPGDPPGRYQARLIPGRYLPSFENSGGTACGRPYPCQSGPLISCP